MWNIKSWVDISPNRIQIYFTNLKNIRIVRLDKEISFLINRIQILHNKFDFLFCSNKGFWLCLIIFLFSSNDPIQHIQDKS